MEFCFGCDIFRVKQIGFADDKCPHKNIPLMIKSNSTSSFSSLLFLLIITIENEIPISISVQLV